jgi:CRP/FNR family transcriptional regulator, cyclic AMP receptor protein
VAHRIPPHLHRIRAIPLFAACTARQLARIDALSTEVTVDPGTVLQREGLTVAQFCVVVDGRVSTSVAGCDGDELRPGAFFGAVGLVERRDATTTVTTSARTTLRAFGRNDFRALVETVAPVGLALSRCGGSDAHHGPARLEPVPSTVAMALPAGSARTSIS